MTDKPLSDAMEWLENVTTGAYAGLTFSEHSADMATVLRAELAKPRLPEEPTEEIIDVLIDACGWVECQTNQDWVSRVYRALYAHFTAPKTKTVQVWRCEWSQYPDAWKAFSQSEGHGDAGKAWAEGRARWLRDRPEFYTCIRVTGPHDQEVPA